MPENQNRPEWVPENPGKEFTTNVMKGVDQTPFTDVPVKPRRGLLPADEYVKGVLSGNRTLLAKTITLIESNAPKHHKLAQEVLNKLLPKSGNSIRIGITGVPGVGKSTFIEALGLYLCEQGHKVAVLAIDPSSTLTKGSILGDKTRMEELARHPDAFIRPSPSSGTLGGVANKSRETMLACEAFGFDVILIETVGVGQSEIAVRSMTDFFMLLVMPGTGDELQGIKKGIIEIADGMVINKADGDFATAAQRAQSQFKSVLQLLTPATPGWKPQVLTSSALKNIGIPETWTMVKEFTQNTQDSGVFTKRRREQSTDWFHSILEDHIKHQFFENPEVKDLLPQLKKDVFNDTLTPAEAAYKLIQTFNPKKL